jgi:transposase
MRLDIRLQREVARLHFYDASQSNRAIAKSVGISPGAAASVRTLLNAQALSWNALKELDDEQWCRALGSADRSVKPQKATPDWSWIHQEMGRPDATRHQLWQEWKETCPDGIEYSQFTEKYREWIKAQHVVLRRTHRPGDKLFVDFAGRTVEIRDPAGAPSKFAQIFVAVLGCSNYTYVQATASQTTADWLTCHINCFEALGGVPKWIVCDNLKAAVVRRTADDITLNPAYREMLRHYDCVVLPAGPRKPKHKAKAEVGVQIVQRFLLFKLRNRVFFSLEELNSDLRRHTASLNEHPFKKMPGCRRERFESSDKPALKPLPEHPFEICEWRYAVRVGEDHHFEHGRSYYSVPFAYARERVDLRITSTVIEAFSKGRRIAMHALLKTAGETSTVQDHRPIVHMHVLEGEPKALTSWAEAVGPHAAKMIRYHLQERIDATNGVKAARRMRDLARTYGEERFEAVCAYALPLNITALRSITSILSNQADLRSRPLPVATPRPEHVNLRGPQYFGDES